MIKAEDAPIKHRPEEPGGMDVPHQDKLVFNRLPPGQVENQVERLLPPPEEPVAQPEPSAPSAPTAHIGRASGRARVCHYGYIAVVPEPLKNKITQQSR